MQRARGGVEFQLASWPAAVVKSPTLKSPDMTLFVEGVNITPCKSRRRTFIARSSGNASSTAFKVLSRSRTALKNTAFTAANTIAQTAIAKRTSIRVKALRLIGVGR